MSKTTKTTRTTAQGATPATKQPTNSRHEVKCCFCGHTIPRPDWDKTDSPYYLGTNNPWPFAADDDGARCCADCNMLHVMPARMCGITPEEARRMQPIIAFAWQNREARKTK